jgi:hypothetical protein
MQSVGSNYRQKKLALAAGREVLRHKVLSYKLFKLADLVAMSSFRLRMSRRVSPVSSRGCSKLFVIRFLKHALKYVSQLPAAPDFPFDVVLVEKWLRETRTECTEDPNGPADYGGLKFDGSNPASYWTCAQQFYTWWKNNVERRSKYKTLKKEAAYTGTDKALKKR